MRTVTFPEGKLYHGDCLTVMKKLPDDSIDLICGSPPYEDQRLYLEDGKDIGIAFKKVDDWVNWLVSIYREGLRVCKGLIALVVGHGKNGSQKWSAAPALLIAALKKEKICLRNPLLYHRQSIPGSGGVDWLRADYEWIVCATRGGALPWADNTAMGHKPRYAKAGGKMTTMSRSQEQKIAVQKARGNVGSHRARRQAGDKCGVPKISNPGNVIFCGTVGGSHMGTTKKVHTNEAPFPELVPEFIIRSFCPPGGVVFDPFSGSGTTAAVAIKCGRKFIASDLRNSQIDLSKARIQEVRDSNNFGLYK